MNWEEKIRESDAGKAKPEEAEAIIEKIKEREKLTQGHRAPDG